MILYHQWMRLAPLTKVTIATAFGITKSGPTHVANNEVVADGYKIQDIERALNLAALQAYLNTTEGDYIILWDKLIRKTEGKEEPIPEPAPVEKEPQKVQKKRGRPRKVIA